MRSQIHFAGRTTFLKSLFLLAAVCVVVRAIQLQLVEYDFLRKEGIARQHRILEIPAHRGMINDRDGEPLAISSPVYSVWSNPKEALTDKKGLAKLAKIAAIDTNVLISKLKKRSDKQFFYIKRHIDPQTAQQIQQLKLNGIYLEREYRRYYPTSEVSSQIIGFTNIDDTGLEGIELEYEWWLRGEPGLKKVIKDRRERVVDLIEGISSPKPGRDLTLSIDRRIQYIAYRELKVATAAHHAKSASAVLLDVNTGEVVAMANVPSFNPNSRGSYKKQTYRNRAVTDVFEPGSVLKPFTVACALESKRYSPNTVIHTSPGKFNVGKYIVRDIRDFGALTVSGVIAKSSNVGASKIALDMPSEAIWSTLADFGFGTLTETNFPGEAAGTLKHFSGWKPIEKATVSFGYGVSVTALQLARAYAIIAADGVAHPVTFIKASETHTSHRVLSENTARQLQKILAGVVSDAGTGRRAAVRGYTVAGKTGTVHKSTQGGYDENRFLSLFAGFAPAHDPRLALVVVVNEPNTGMHMGGEVAAPVFAKIMSEALRLLDIPPDNVPQEQSPSILLHSDAV